MLGQFTLVVVPEPATVILLSLAGLALLHRRARGQKRGHSTFLVKQNVPFCSENDSAIAPLAKSYNNTLDAAVSRLMFERAVNASIRRLPERTHHSRPRRLARSYLVRLLHSRPSSGLTTTHPDPFDRHVVRNPG